MKTLKNLYQNLLSKEKIKEILLAHLKGKPYASQVKSQIDRYVDITYDNLIREEYVLKPVKKVIIHDRKKDREITKSSYYPNKVFDYLITNQLKQMITKSMYHWSVGNVKGRGKDLGIAYLEKHIRKYKYALKLDIKKFYDNIDKEILFNHISKRVSDKKFLNFYKSIIGNKGKGLDLGLNSSQWLSNFYLQDLDYIIKQTLKAKAYVRYVDDMIILGNNKRRLHYYIRMIQQYLTNNLALKLKDNYQLLNLVKGDEIEFLGYKINHQRTNLIKPLFYRFVKLYKRMIDKSKRRAKTVTALWGWFKRSTYSYMYYKRYLEPIIPFGDIRMLLQKGGQK